MKGVNLLTNDEVPELIMLSTTCAQIMHNIFIENIMHKDMEYAYNFAVNCMSTLLGSIVMSILNEFSEAKQKFIGDVTELTAKMLKAHDIYTNSIKH